MDRATSEYYQRRERAERAAAKSASCPQARRVHQELAQAYAGILQEQRIPAAAFRASEPRPRLSIVVPAHA